MIPDDIDNIWALKEEKDSVINSIEKIKIPEGRSILSGSENSFSIRRDSFRSCPRLYDENGMFIVDSALIDYTGDTSDVIVPDGIEELNENCFGRTEEWGTESKINSVSLPSSLKVIGNCAFLCCSRLVAVSVRGESQLECIGAYAFAGCEALKDFILPDSLKTVGEEAFGANFDNDRPKLTKMDGSYCFVGSVMTECFDTKSVVNIPKGTTIIADSVFRNKRNIVRVVLPKSLKTIGKNTFRDCTGLRDINVDQCADLLYIGESAFEGCCQLKHISANDEIKHIGKDAFRLKCVEIAGVSVPEQFIERNGGKRCCNNYLGIPDENGLLIRNDVLLEAYKKSSIINIPEGVKTILFGSLDFYDCGNAEAINIVFPSSLRVLADSTLLYNDRVTYTLDENYLGQKCGLNDNAILRFFNKREDVVLDDDIYISLYLYHTAKSNMELEDIYIPYLLKDPNYTVQMFIEYLAENGGMPEYVHAAEFVVAHKEKISDAIIAQFYELCVENKKKKAVDLIKNMLPEVLNEHESKDVDVDPLEEYCKKKYGYRETEEALKKARIRTTSALKKCPVRYKDSDTVVPDLVVKCAILPYLDIDGTNPVIVDEAEELAAKFDKESYKAFLRRLTDTAFKKMSEKTRWPDIGDVDKIIHIAGRYGDEAILEDLIKAYEQRSRQSVADFEGRHIRQVLKYSELLKGAILLNETEKAAQYCYSNAWLSKYASLRTLSEEECISKYNINCSMSEDELSLVRAFDLYEKSIMMLEAAMNGGYGTPTVIETPPSAGGISVLGKRLFEIIRDAYKEGTRMGSYDYMNSPDELYSLWMNNLSVHEGSVGINFSVGLIVAEYAFTDHNESGELVFCRDKWEYRNDYSSSTRAALKIVPDIDKWEAYNKTGYPVFDM